ncbi:alpha/beta hydrolase [Paenibacillus sp. IB182496]|uniref:Alpha/beta hydrolase n=2 Tax=Paenibacillus sabuli TaxID=2772509 RepID=A0A927BQJ7_9BACL|nr:alpha/beta hydrolase [Paenibacillus sabuli]
MADRKLAFHPGGEVPTGELAYYDSAPEGAPGPALVLLHGYCGSSAYWQKTAPYLQSAARLIIPDLRGHGASCAPDQDVYAMEDFADDLQLLLDELQLPRPIVIGHSLGGYIALAAAERYGERLGGIGLVHSTAHADTEAAKAGRDKAVDTLVNEGIRIFVDGLVPKLFAPEHLETLAMEVEAVKEIGYRTDVNGAAATARGMKARPDRNAVLQRADLPVLLVAGTRDGVVPAERTFSAEGAHIRTCLLEGAGHMGMIESAPEEAQALRAFAASAASTTD